MARISAWILTLLLCVPATAELTMTSDEREAWATLSDQIEAGVAGNWDTVATYFHSEYVTWGATLPIPHPRSMATDQIEFLLAGAVEYLAYDLLPLTVNVVGDTATINAIFRSAVRSAPGAQPSELHMRLHNTWIRTDDGWKLLSNYNTTVQ